MSLRIHKYQLCPSHQRAGRLLQERVAELTLREELRGYSGFRVNAGSFGEIITCPAAVVIDELVFRQKGIEDLAFRQEADEARSVALLEVRNGVSQELEDPKAAYENGMGVGGQVTLGNMIDIGMDPQIPQIKKEDILKGWGMRITKNPGFGHSQPQVYEA